MASDATPVYGIPFPRSTDPVNVASDLQVLAEAVETLLSTIPQQLVEQTTDALFQITPLDDMSFYFDGVEDTFEPQYNGVKEEILNPYRVLLTINGLVQTPNFPDYVNLPPIFPEGFVLNTDGTFTFTPIPQSGDTFDARVMPGAIENEKRRQYFEPLNLLMGD